ncbi:hypothetical protein ACKXGF_05075 [Alkalibacillus sp. S2W]|uniref:hypothetical protein n=1 Tax=Alkalibacillus sp. S2W TaxID=3386553 RepID=UPI00398D249B
MRQNYQLILFYEDNQTDVLTITSNTPPNAESKVVNNTWVKCEESGRYFNMNKVRWFQVQENE